MSPTKAPSPAKAVMSVSTTLRDSVKAQLSAAIEADPRSLSAIADAAFDCVARNGGERIRKARARGWMDPDLLEAVAGTLGFDVELRFVPKAGPS